MNYLNKKPFYLFLLLSVTNVTNVLKAGVRDNLAAGYSYVAGKAGSLWNGVANSVKNDWDKGAKGKAKIMAIGAAGVAVTALVIYYANKKHASAKPEIK